MSARAQGVRWLPILDRKGIPTGHFVLAAKQGYELSVEAAAFVAAKETR
jgi:hypothetical protein